MITKSFLFLFIILFHASNGFGQTVNENGWWPVQKKPAKIITCIPLKETDTREMNLIQSVSGLAAQAINEGKNDEGVWISYTNSNYTLYYRSLVERMKLKETGTRKTWDLVKRFINKKIIKGYILYDLKRLDNSINLATIYAGLYKGILIDVTQEKKAIALGLSKLEDVTSKQLDESTFLQLRERLNNEVIVIMNPRMPNNKDFAIAHKAMVYYGVDSLLEKILQWVKPLSPVIGWNSGDESKHIEPCTRWGLINTVSDFCMNLPMLSVHGEEVLPKVKPIDPQQIDWKKKGIFHSFVMSDGDNMQWTSNQFINSTDYWNNPNNEALQMGFTSCLLNLSMGSIDVYKRLLETQPNKVSLIEYGGGYYYPDLFATSRTNKEELCKQYARMMNEGMKRTGTKVFGVICKNLASENAAKMFRLFVEEIDDLTGMVAVQYAPYNGGYGKTIWLKNKKGVSIPVVTAKYQLWANLKRKGSGNPDDIAQAINTDSTNSQFSWTIVHAWSRFEKNEQGFTDVQKNQQNGERGVTPVKWVTEKLNKDISIVSIEELLWRVRMDHNAEETTKAISDHTP